MSETPPGSCHGEVCITCSDSAVPVVVLGLYDDETATVGAAGGEERISVALVDARVGDVLLAHAGEALAVLERAP